MKGILLDQLTQCNRWLLEMTVGIYLLFYLLDRWFQNLMSDVFNLNLLVIIAMISSGCQIIIEFAKRKG